MWNSWRSLSVGSERRVISPPLPDTQAGDTPLYQCAAAGRATRYCGDSSHGNCRQSIGATGLTWLTVAHCFSQARDAIAAVAFVALTSPPPPPAFPVFFSPPIFPASLLVLFIFSPFSSHSTAIKPAFPPPSRSPIPALTEKHPIWIPSAWLNRPNEWRFFIFFFSPLG